jgi:hypothetical protein
MIAVALPVTGLEAIANVALTAPAGTTMLDGTVATPMLLLVRVTVTPPVGAAAVSRAVPVAVAPAVTVVGLSVTDDSAITAGLTVRTAVFVTPLYAAEIVAVAVAVTGCEVIVNVALVAPAGTTTLAGRVAAAVLLLVKVTITPPEGAGALRLAVPVEVAPPVSVEGLIVADASASAAGLMVNAAVFVTALYTAETDTVVAADTGLEVAVNVAVMAPAGTTMLAGTVTADVLLLLSAIVTPPVGAAELNVTVPVDVPPAVRTAGLTATDASAATDVLLIFATNASRPPPFAPCIGFRVKKFVESVTPPT